MRKVQFANGEYYHIFNRGVDKREIFLSEEDLLRFLQSMDEFNSLEPIGSIYQNTFEKYKIKSNAQKGNLVNIICYCLNPNHYHLILEQVADNGIKKYMHRLGGYTMFFNNKYKRSGALFQGTYKAVHVASNEYLLRLSAYVNLNNRVHQLRGLASKSSWEEYIGDKNEFCKKDIIMNQFNNPMDYKEFAEDALMDIKERKEMEKLLLD